MAEPFIGEIRAVGFNYAPRGWKLCDGSLLSISQYSSLYALLGINFGGNGTTTFGIPDLRGRTAIGFGQGAGTSFHPLGAMGGAETVSLTQAQMPQHAHSATLTDAHTTMGCSTETATSSIPSPTSVLAKGEAKDGKSVLGDANIYNESVPDTTLLHSDVTGSIAVGDAGASQAHNNMQPFCTINYIIATEGIWPSRP